MTIQLPPAIEADLRSLAEKQGRDVLALIEEAVQQYMDDVAITDVSPADVAAAQIAVLGEISSPPWHDDPT
jgi:predicted transcriptional regulator